MSGVRFIRMLLCLAITLGMTANSGAEESTPTVIKVDPVALIRQAAVKHQGRFKTADRDAVARMDSMLMQQYGARGRIANEKDVALKVLYYNAASLLLNGYPIAGGTLVSVARNEPSFSRSAVGPAFVAFVDAMLQPTEGDEDLATMQSKTAKARTMLAGLRGDLRFYAELWVVGTIYRDAIATDAGKLGIDAMKASASERKLLSKTMATVK